MGMNGEEDYHMQMMGNKKFMNKPRLTDKRLEKVGSSNRNRNFNSTIRYEWECFKTSMNFDSISS